MFKYDICVVGGCGRVGLPLAIAFADKGMKVVIYDLDKNRCDLVKKGFMPFSEEGCEEKLKQTAGKKLHVGAGPKVISKSKFVITTTGTPVEEHLNPQYSAMLKFFQGILPYLVEGQCVILRSTVYPGTAGRINEFLKGKGLKVHLAFCPERIAEGKALKELHDLPQIVSGFDREGIREASKLFSTITDDIIVIDPIEAELAKLFTNTWRYIQFAAANQFYMLANRCKLDYYKIHNAMTYKYPRMQALPSPGFAAGPCLFKDTMQLSAFSNNTFFMGHSSMLVNEGLPNYLVEQLKESINLGDKAAGILGMAFKANSDDERDSLSFKLKKLLEMEAREVYCSDPYVKRDYFISAEKLVKKCDVIIVGAPHDVYKKLKIGKDKILVDVWNLYKRGGKI